MCFSTHFLYTKKKKLLAWVVFIECAKLDLVISPGYLLFCNYFIKFVDAFLLAIYNTEAAEQQSNRAMSTAIVNMPANPLIRPSLIKVPPLATSSTYHDSARLESEDKLDQRPSGKTYFRCAHLQKICLTHIACVHFARIPSAKKNFLKILTKFSKLLGKWKFWIK